MHESAQQLAIVDVLYDPALSDPRLVLKIAKETVKMLKDLHTLQLVLTELDVSCIHVRNWTQVWLIL